MIGEKWRRYVTCDRVSTVCWPAEHHVDDGRVSHRATGTADCWRGTRVTFIKSVILRFRINLILCFRAKKKNNLSISWEEFKGIYVISQYKWLFWKIQQECFCSSFSYVLLDSEYIFKSDRFEERGGIVDRNRRVEKSFNQVFLWKIWQIF